MSRFEAALAIVSTIVGGGIVGVPYSLLHAGIPFGIFLHFIVALSVSYSCTLYIHAKDLIPIQVESLYEIGFSVMGRCSIYLVSVIVWVASIGLMMIYFIVFGDIASSISRQLIFTKDPNNFFASRAFFVLVLGSLLTPLVIKRALKELKCISILLFVAIGLFIILFLGQIIIEGPVRNNDKDYA